MIREVLTHPDPRLRRRCMPVGRITRETRELASDLRETMYALGARGLAAPEIGVLARILVVDADGQGDGGTAITFIDPRVVAASRDVVAGDERCVTLPGGGSDVRRPRWIALRWTDLDGAKREGRFDGAWAVAVQHGLDHLDGRLIVDHGGSGLTR